MRLNYLSNAIGVIMADVGYMSFVPLIVSIFYKEWSCAAAFLFAGLLSVGLGYILQWADKKRVDPDTLNDIKRSEALIVAALSWILFGVIAAIPFVFNGFSIIDSLFEAVSGITTTGATILTSFDIPKSLLFWRAFTQWLGGMGIIVLFVAILPQFAVAGRQMFFDEITGPTEEKLTPRIRNTASALWVVYTVLTLLCAVCLYFAGMNPFDCICNAMSTLAAGGFSPNPESIGGYHSNAIIYIIFVFMFIAGASFVVQSKVLTRLDPRIFWKSEEFRLYTKIIVFVSLVLSAILYFENHFTIGHSLRAGFYQVLSLATSTGSSSEDYHYWSLNAKIVLFISMFLSSCSGSAGGGVKMTRWLLLFKYMKNELYRILHPNVVMSVKIDKVGVSNNVIKQTIFFLGIYFLIYVVSAIVITCIEHDIVIGGTSAIASLGIVGPALGHVIGPYGHYASMSVLTKIILIMNMFIGRLEIIPFLVLFRKESWKIKG